MYILPLLYVLTGTINVLLIKWSDTLKGECSDGELRRFQHPLVQTFLMFLGEFLCFVIYKITYIFLQRRGHGSENEHILTRGGHEFTPLSLLLPAFLDAVASLMLFTGLYLTYVSSFQMLRVTSLIFVGIFGTIYLNQNLIARHWMAMFTMTCGIITIVSIDMQRVWYDYASLPKAEENSVLTGNLLVICAQIIHAAKFVYEEKLVKSTDVPPMQAAGWQGIFGLLITIVLGVCLNFMPTPVPINNNSRGVFDDLGDVIPQLRSNPILLLPFGLFICSCTCYNFASLSIVKFSSTTNRLLADSLCIILIWWMALVLEWEILNLITIMGFVIILMGMIAYRNAIFIEWYRSLLARLARRRYTDLNAETSNEGGSNAEATTSRPADII